MDQLGYWLSFVLSALSIPGKCQTLQVLQFNDDFHAPNPEVSWARIQNPSSKSTPDLTFCVSINPRVSTAHSVFDSLDSIRYE